MSELDLETGDSSRGDSASERRKRRRSSESSSGTTSPRAEAKLDNEVRSQVNRALDGIGKNRYAHGDTELGDALADEADAMTEGFVMLTANVPVLRMPIIILLNLAIVLLAFGRVGGIVLGRLRDRRERIRAEVAAQEQAPYQSAEDLIQER